MPEKILKTPILIVGAGPTGLMTACQLTRFGIDHIIIDKRSGPSDKSRAIGIQARTLEIFEQMRIQDIFLKNGEKIGQVKIYSRNFNIAHVKFGDFGKGLSPYPFVLILGQQITEEALTGYAKKNGSKVTWDTEAVSFEEKKDTIVTTIKTKDGKKQKVESQYVIGADGAHSTVRHHIKADFGGNTYDTQFWLADATISWKQPQNTLLVWFTKRSFLAFFPMGKSTYRLTGALPTKHFDKEELSIEEMQDIIDSLDIPAKITDATWTSIFNLHHRNTETFRKGRFFLAGDAGHIHSPAGAQGMNTGLQDAYNLSWKLAFVLKGYMKEKILDTYDQERLPFAKQLTKTTDRLFSMVVTKNPFKKLFRNALIWTVSNSIKHFETGRHMFFKLVSQTAIAYPNSMLSKDNGANTMYTAGSRMPPIQDAFTHDKMTLLVSHRTDDLDNIIEEYKHIIKQEVVSKKIIEDGFILVRPDMYIACMGKTPQELSEYLSGIFIKSVQS